MKKIRLTEAQIKQLQEMEVVQYQENSSDTKQFYSEVKGSDIDYDTNNQTLHDADLAENSIISIDWICDFNFFEGGFKFTPKINRVSGILYFKRWDFDESKEINLGKVTVDTNNGWKIALSSYGLEAESNQLSFPRDANSGVEVLLDSKTIKLTN